MKSLSQAIRDFAQECREQNLYLSAVVFEKSLMKDNEELPEYHKVEIRTE